MHRPVNLALLAALGLASTGCMSAAKPPIESDTKLGQVIVYRNGVAYFERFAPATQKELKLKVPTDRVNDFLKSLTVSDLKSGEPLPLSYPTVDGGSGKHVNMTISLPAKHDRLRVTYVTESPSWKPSYRIILDDEGKGAKLHGWAVVDNVSGEDWKNVRIGVGSTSALSFRFDLHSIRLVERRTLSTGQALALAPPTGGTPYAVAGKKVRVLGNFSSADLGGGRNLNLRLAAKAEAVAEAPNDADDDTTADKRRRRKHGKVRQRRKGQAYFKNLSRRLQSGGRKVRIEGYAQRGDGNARSASLRRAQQVRKQLIRNGVPAHQIEVVGTGLYNARDVVRVLEVGDEAQPRPIVAGRGGKDTGKRLGQPGANKRADARPDDGQPLGQAHFVSAEPMTIAAQHSAMVSILNKPATAERVYFYDPVSDRGSKRFAFNAVRIENPSQYTLDAGPFTVYSGSQFLGEGLSEAILPKSTAFIPYALDRSILVETERKAREEIEKLVTIQRGIVNTETRRILRTKLELANRGKSDAKIYVRHALRNGYTLKSGPVKPQKMGGTLLFPVEVKAGETLALNIEEWTPLMKTVDIRTNKGVSDIALYLKKAKLPADLATKLDGVVARHNKTADLNERIRTLDKQMAVYRRRVDELNVQLVTLKKVRQAARLRAHLAKKMEEISDRLQQATITMTDLKGQLMTQKIDLQDALAELTLRKQRGDKAPKLAAAP